MAIKDKVLELLDDNKGKYLSGEQLADTLGCTRGAVWKEAPLIWYSKTMQIRVCPRAG